MNENTRIVLLAIFWTAMAAAVLAILFLPPTLQDCFHILRDHQPPAFLAVAGNTLVLDDHDQN